MPSFPNLNAPAGWFLASLADHVSMMPSIHNEDDLANSNRTKTRVTKNWFTLTSFVSVFLTTDLSHSPFDIFL